MRSNIQAINPALAESTEGLARLFKALADPLRLDILHLLRSGSFGVLELCRIVDVRQSALSHHLNVLAQAGLVSTRREGNSIFYRRALILADDPLSALKINALAALDKLSLSEKLAAGVQQVHDERSEQSLLFFERHAEQFLARQELVAEYSHYSEALLDLIDGLKLPALATVAEVGPGESPLLSALASRFSHLTALDNSQEMLNRARAALLQQPIDGNAVRFVHGDTRSLLDQQLQFELMIFNMVLHHIPSPQSTFQDCARLLKKGGTLLLADLSHHDQDWVRDTCGDLWLGFTEQDLDCWAMEAGLSCGQQIYLGLRNGFQVQIRLFNK